MLTLCFVSHPPKGHPGLLIQFSLNVTHNLSLFSQGSESSSHFNFLFLSVMLGFRSVKWYMMLIS